MGSAWALAATAVGVGADDGVVDGAVADDGGDADDGAVDGVCAAAGEGNEAGAEDGAGEGMAACAEAGDDAGANGLGTKASLVGRMNGSVVWRPQTDCHSNNKRKCGNGRLLAGIGKRNGRGRANGCRIDWPRFRAGGRPSILRRRRLCPRPCSPLGPFLSPRTNSFTCLRPSPCSDPLLRLCSGGWVTRSASAPHQM